MNYDLSKRARKRGRQAVDPDRFRAQRFEMEKTGPSRNSPAARLLFLAVGLACLGWALFLGTQMGPDSQESGTDRVVLIEETLVPEPEPEPPPPPPTPRPPPPDPIQPPPPEEPPAEEPTPQFGIQEEATSEVGAMAVATGNTLMTEADSVVKEAPPPLPPAPLFYDQPPRMLKGMAPEYPRRALNWGLEATVIALITIDNTGKVVQVEIEKSGGKDFDRNVERAARKALFEPPLKQGKPMACTFRQPFEFKLEG